LNIKDGYNLSLTLGHVDIAFNAQNLGDFRGNSIFFGGDGSELFGEVVLGPVAGIFVDLMQIRE